MVCELCLLWLVSFCAVWGGLISFWSALFLRVCLVVSFVGLLVFAFGRACCVGFLVALFGGGGFLFRGTFYCVVLWLWF